MALSILFGNQYLILYMEVGDIIFEVNILGDDKGSYNLIVYFSNESVVDTSWIDSTLVERFVHFLGFVQMADQIFSSFKILLSDSMNVHILLKQVVSVHDVKNMLEGVLGLLCWEGKLVQQL